MRVDPDRVTREVAVHDIDGGFADQPVAKGALRIATQKQGDGRMCVRPAPGGRGRCEGLQAKRVSVRKAGG
jgi:hypothetical protein